MSDIRASDLGSLPSQDPSFRPENHPSLWENDSEDSYYPNNEVDPAHPPSLHPSVQGSESEADSQNKDGIDEDQPVNLDPHQQSDEDQDPDQEWEHFDAGAGAGVFNPNPGPIDSEEENPRDPREWYDAPYNRPVGPAKEPNPDRYSYNPELGYNPQLTPKTAAKPQQEKGQRELREQVKTQGTSPLRAPLDGIPTTPTLHKSQEKNRKELRRQIRTEGASPLRVPTAASPNPFDKLAKPQEARQRREGLRGNPALYEANRKQQAAKEQAEYDTLLESPLMTPPTGTPTPNIAGAQEKTHPPSTVAKTTSPPEESPLQHPPLGVYRFNRERGINQRLDAIESNHNSTRHTLQDTNQALQGLDINQNNLQKQILQLGLNQIKFEATVLQWLDNLDARINPILQVQALTLKAVSLNQAMNQEINIAHVRLESYTDTVLLSHVNSNILTTQEFDMVASKLQEVTELRAIHNPYQIPCAMTSHRDAQSISVIFAIPLTEPEPYTLIRLIPIKSFQDKQSVIPKLQHQ
jgi:hypothetical protein